MSSKQAIIERHLPVETDGVSALDFLVEHTELPRSVLKEAMHKGAVWLSREQVAPHQRTRREHTQRLRRVKKSLQVGDRVHVYYNPGILQQQANEPHCIADEGDYSVWYKPFGVSCQGSKWGDHCTIHRLVEVQRQQPVYLVHRLDKATTGLMLLAHSKSAARALSELFQQRKIKKCYQAIVDGQVALEPQTLTQAIDGREAITHIEVISYDDRLDRSLLQATIETGRKHQIRIHLANIGHPIVGDRLHGDRALGPEQEQTDLQLCCVELQFICPLTEQARHYQLPTEFCLDRPSAE